MKSLEGQKAPAFDLEGNDGKRHSLEDYKGKTVVLYFYPKDDTPGCTKEACGFRDLGASLQKSGAVVLGISKDTVESHNKFAGKYKLPFPLLSDPKAEVMKKYGAFGKKMMYGKTVEVRFAPRSSSVLKAMYSNIGRPSKRPRLTHKKCSHSSKSKRFNRPIPFGSSRNLNRSSALP